MTEKKAIWLNVSKKGDTVFFRVEDKTYITQKKYLKELLEGDRTGVAFNEIEEKSEK